MSGCTTNSDILLASILENCLDIITVKDLNAKYIACNKAFLQFSNIETEEDVIGRHVCDVLSAYDSKQYIFDMFEEVIKTGEPRTYTFTLKNEKIYKIINQTSTPIVENGKITRILSVSRDVTHEENLKLKLVDKISQLNTLLENLPMLVYMQDKNLKYITGSKYTRDFVEKGFDYYSNYPDIDMVYTSKLIAEENEYVLENKKILQVEQKTKALDGSDLWYKICKAPILNDQNDVTGIVTIAQNINNEKFLDAQKEMFLATLTHDLKNPVQAQLMSLNLLRKGVLGELNTEQVEMLDMLIESTTYMQEMLKSILTTYKFDNGVITLEKEYFNAELLMQDCINEIKAFAQSKSVNLICDFDSKGTKLLGDVQQLRRVISNLLNNALNYSYEGSDLYLSIKNNGKKMVFGFDNMSPVIPEHIKVQIFDKYVTGAKSFKLTGIGLGLYFSKKVIEAHNGKIYLDANGERNKFVFEVPLVDELINTSIAW